MSHLNKDPQRRLAVKPFSRIPGIEGLQNIVRPPYSGPPSATSARTGSSTGSYSEAKLKARAEPCLVTKAVNYTHERMYWINLVRNDGRRRKEVTNFIRSLRITPPSFDLDDVSNLSNLDRVIHKSLDSYAFIAVTGSRKTLAGLIAWVLADNDRRQAEFDVRGVEYGRALNFGHPSFENPEFELVVLHPEHFLPSGAVLTIYDRAQGTRKSYVPSADRRLRESPNETASPTIPPFSAPHREPGLWLNPFLVILNADIKFRRYVRQEAPAIPLPHDVQTLMRMTMELVDLVYWNPEVRPGTAAERARNYRLDTQSKVSSDHAIDVEMGWITEEEGDPTLRSQGRGHGHRLPPEFPWPEDADLETRMAMGSALLSGRNLDFTSDDEDFLEELHRSGL